MKTKKQNKRLAKVFFAKNGKAKMSKAGYGQSGKMLSTMKRMMAVDATADVVKHPPKRKATPHLDLMREIAKTNNMFGRMADLSMKPDWFRFRFPERSSEVYITRDGEAKKWLIDVKSQLSNNPASAEKMFGKKLLDKINNVK
jgi:hypothetical protein